MLSIYQFQKPIIPYDYSEMEFILVKVSNPCLLSRLKEAEGAVMEVIVEFGPEFFAKAIDVVKAWEEGSGWYEANPETGCGYAPIIAGVTGGGSWTTSAGNSMVLLISGQGVVLSYEGRRHGLGGMICVEEWMKEGRVTTYKTDTPHLAWWETESAAARLKRTGVRRNPETGVNERFSVRFDDRRRRYEAAWTPV